MHGVDDTTPVCRLNEPVQLGGSPARAAGAMGQVGPAAGKFRASSRGHWYLIQTRSGLETPVVPSLSVAAAAKQAHPSGILLAYVSNWLPTHHGSLAVM